MNHYTVHGSNDVQKAALKENQQQQHVMVSNVSLAAANLKTSTNTVAQAKHNQ